MKKAATIVSLCVVFAGAYGGDRPYPLSSLKVVDVDPDVTAIISYKDLPDAENRFRVVRISPDEPSVKVYLGWSSYLSCRVSNRQNVRFKLDELDVNPPQLEMRSREIWKEIALVKDQKSQTMGKLYLDKPRAYNCVGGKSELVSVRDMRGSLNLIRVTGQRVFELFLDSPGDTTFLTDAKIVSILTEQKGQASIVPYTFEMVVRRTPDFRLFVCAGTKVEDTFCQ